MKRTLLLNSRYEPIRFIGERKALSLVLRGVADPLSFWEKEVMLRTYHVTGKALELPAVLALKQWHNRRARLPRFKREVVFARDDYTCQYCARVLSSKEATIDHVFPKSQGGQLIWKNAVTSCRPCNRYKDNNTPEKAGMKLLRTPTNPTVAHFWDLRHDDIGWHASWDAFIPK